MDFYTLSGGDDTKIYLKDKNGKTLAKISGKDKCQYNASGYPAYELIVAGGIAEVVEHKKMEPTFYINDDPAIRQKLLTCNV